MTDIERLYFDKLRNLHLGFAETLRDPRVSGVKDVISNLYRDEAHFVYELLQNADDRGATYALFRLSADGLIFIHNAPRLFTVTDPDRHESDRAAGCLGDVNSILSIASSSKRGHNDDVPIGKFGLGFKSVFRYTRRPEIYDAGIRFAISDYIVPEAIECDHPLRQSHETLFYFPFDDDNKGVAYEDIASKLAGLDHPLLFLNHMARIEWESDEDEGRYELKPVGDIASGVRLRYDVSAGTRTESVEMWKFTEPVDDDGRLSVAVVYVTDGTGRVEVTETYPLYCYLPTANNTALPVILHAPFRLTGNRESILTGDDHNRLMIGRLSGLLVRSLDEICRTGEAVGRPPIDDSILAFIPHVTDPRVTGQTDRLVSTLHDDILGAICSGRMLWCGQLCRYIDAGSAYVAENGYLSEVYPSPLLSEIMGERRGWVLPSLTAGLKTGDNVAKSLGIERVTPEKILRKITPDILAVQSDAWLKQWYRSLERVKNLWRGASDPFLRYREIILTGRDRIFAAPFVKGIKTSNVHLPGCGDDGVIPEGLHMIAGFLVEDEDLLTFFKDLGLTEVDDFTKAEQVCLPQIKDETAGMAVRLGALARFARIYNTRLTVTQQSDLLSRCLFPASDGSSPVFVNSGVIKIHNSDNDLYYRHIPGVRFYEPACLDRYLSADDIAAISHMINDVSEARMPTVRMRKYAVDDSNESRRPAGAQRTAYGRERDVNYAYFIEPEIEGFTHFVNNVPVATAAEASSLVERLIKLTGNAEYCVSWYSSLKEYPLQPLYFDSLRKAPWIEFASHPLRKLLGLPVKELQAAEIGTLTRELSSSGITDRDEVERLIQFMKRDGVLERFCRTEAIERQKEVVGDTVPFTRRWLDEVLTLRLKYVEAGKKDDIEFLISSLKQAIGTLDVDADADLRKELPDGINIIFGPPGTGKTTRIASLVKEMVSSGSCNRVLILTPTNAAANVVAERINDSGCEAYRCANRSNREVWSEIEERGLSGWDVSDGDIHNVMVSTVHFYSMFMHELPWDCIIVDEASMVTLDYMLLALFKGAQNNPGCQFHIVGDPLQLPAITNPDPFILEEAELDEFNIYSFIGLNEFSDTPSGMDDALRSKFNIELLVRQYRSVPQLCRLTGAFAYDNRLIPSGTHKPVVLPDNVPDIFGKPLSFVRYPVTESEDIQLTTDLYKLKGSNFNIYPALFVKLTLQRLFDRLIETGSTEKLRIGIITPYTAQKKLIERLLNTGAVTRGANVDVCVNTVHKFQGDEFNIVMLVLNPPNTGMTPRDKILINKRYLINVATSRAMDSMIVIYPDESCNEANFTHINRHAGGLNIESVAGSVFGCSVENLTYNAAEIMRRMFGDDRYIENNSTVTMRDDVNYHRLGEGRLYKFEIGHDFIDIIHNK